MRPRRSGKRLLYIAVLQEFCECGRGVLFSAVTVKSETAGIAAFPKSGPEGAGDQVRACVAGYPIADDLAGEKIQDDTKVDPVVVDFKICDVTDPDLVGAVCGELLIQQVLLFILLMLFVLLLGIRADAVQPQFLHDCRNAFGADPDTAPGQSDTNLFSAESLGTIIEDLLYQSHKFDLRFLPLAVVSTTENSCKRFRGQYPVLHIVHGRCRCYLPDGKCFLKRTAFSAAVHLRCNRIV